MRPALTALLLLCVACGSDSLNAGGENAATIVARATLLLEPPTLGLGEVTTATLLVTTPPDHRVLPLPPPDLDGVWLLEVLEEPVEKQGGRWLHRTHLRLRPREAGSYSFPATEIAIESATGERSIVHTTAREFRVVSVLPQFPERSAPFGLQAPAAPQTLRSAVLPALAGAALALVATAALRRLRRRRETRPWPAATSLADAVPPSLREWAQSELDAAFAAVDANRPREAANRGARAMRHYVESRFRTPVRAATTDELQVQKPPLAAHRHWRDFVTMLRQMDDLRWRPRRELRPDEDDAQRVRRVLGEARAFLDASSPRETR